MPRETFEARRQSVSTSLCRISYIEQGEGPLALFVHGVIVNGHLQRHQLEELSAERRYIAIDPLDHSWSEANSGQDVSYEAQASMLTQFLDALEVHKVDLVANDSGKGIAQIFATGHPDRVRTLTLTSGDAQDNLPTTESLSFVDMVADGGLAGIIARMADDKDYFCSADGFGDAYEYPENVSDDTVDVYLRPLTDYPQRLADLERFVVAFDCAQMVRIEQDLKKPTVPTLIVWGTEDIFFDT